MSLQTPCLSDSGCYFLHRVAVVCRILLPVPTLGLTLPIPTLVFLCVLGQMGLDLVTINTSYFFQNSGDRDGRI